MGFAVIDSVLEAIGADDFASFGLDTAAFASVFAVIDSVVEAIGADDLTSFGLDTVAFASVFAAIDSVFAVIGADDLTSFGLDTAAFASVSVDAAEGKSAGGLVATVADEAIVETGAVLEGDGPDTSECF